MAVSLFSKELGRIGEDAAAVFLRRAGYRILKRNFTCPTGELDIICHHQGTLVFVEVKTRRDDALGDPEENITPAKQRQLERVARAWLATHGEPDCTYRFDAVSVVLPEKGETRVRHIVEAFIPSR